MRKHDPTNHGGPPGPSRRDFLRGSGVAAATAVLTGQAATAIQEAESGPGGGAENTLGAG